jgi:hypothetical protein
MSGLVNHTPFSARVSAALDAHARPWDVVIVTAAFEVRPDAPPKPVDDPPPIPLADVHFGDPAASSVRYEGEGAWFKPRVDVLVNGSAHAAPGRMIETAEVRVRVGPVDKRLIVSGDRAWGGLLGRSPGKPQPFASMPIVYERAFGGTDSGSKARPAHPGNPVGVGFRGAASADPDVFTRLPNVEYPGDRMTSPGQRVATAGFGVVARAWQPRLALAGTYDDQWLAEQCPLVPLDFDPAHFQAAPEDQQAEELTGGEDVVVENMTPGGTWQFRLPRLDVPLRACVDRRVTVLPTRMDTVLLEPDLFRVTLTLRAAVMNRRNERPVEEYVLGHVSPAWERARFRRKRFIDRAGTGGGVRGATHFIA